jgi:predicted dinucleotide-binding enzyme
MGSAFARRASAAGHDTAITARSLEQARKAATEAGGKARAVPAGEIATGSDLLIAATPYAHQLSALKAAGNLSGKVVIEISNPVNAEFSDLVLGHTTSAAEEIARALRGAKVVKAFNTVFAARLAAGGALGIQREQVFFAGDDEGAKQSVRSCIESIGFEPFDAGPLRNARYLEPIGMLNIYLGRFAKLGTAIAPAWIRG